MDTNPTYRWELQVYHYNNVLVLYLSDRKNISMLLIYFSI